MPTNKININHTKTKNQSQQTQHIFLGICIACLHYWSASVNQHCHTRQHQLNLCKNVGHICPWQYWLGLIHLRTRGFIIILMSATIHCFKMFVTIRMLDSLWQNDILVTRALHGPNHILYNSSNETWQTFVTVYAICDDASAIYSFKFRLREE